MADYRICVICSGNICRSPMGEVILRQLLDEAGLGDRVEVDSAGTGGWHAGDRLGTVRRCRSCDSRVRRHGRPS